MLVYWRMCCFQDSWMKFMHTTLLMMKSPAVIWMVMLLWARGRCRISSPHFLAECCKRQLNQVSLVLLYFRLSAFSDLYWVCLSVFSCTVLFASTSQVIGCEDRLRNDLYCVGWGVKLYSNQTKRRSATISRGHVISPRDNLFALLTVDSLLTDVLFLSILRFYNMITFCLKCVLF